MCARFHEGGEVSGRFMGEVGVGDFGLRWRDVSVGTFWLSL